MRIIKLSSEPLKRGDPIRIKPEWQDAGDDKLDWYVYEDELAGRVGIFTPRPDFIQPWQRVSDYMVERRPGAPWTFKS